MTTDGGDEHPELTAVVVSSFGRVALKRLNAEVEKAKAEHPKELVEDAVCQLREGIGDVKTQPAPYFAAIVNRLAEQQADWREQWAKGISNASAELADEFGKALVQEFQGSPAYQKVLNREYLREHEGMFASAFARQALTQWAREAKGRDLEQEKTQEQETEERRQREAQEARKEERRQSLERGHAIAPHAIAGALERLGGRLRAPQESRTGSPAGASAQQAWDAISEPDRQDAAKVRVVLTTAQAERNERLVRDCNVWLLKLEEQANPLVIETPNLFPCSPVFEASWH